MTTPVFPIIVPRSYFAHDNWRGNYLLLNHPELAVTWVELTRDNAMLYVNKDRHKELEAKHGHLHQHAMCVLRQQSENQLATHAKEDGGRTVFLGMMHSDGLGSSRLLLLPELHARFPNGFHLAIPDRSCGLVMPLGLPTEDVSLFTTMVNNCYEGATTPMLAGVYNSHDFELAPG
jgi:hypothetical protein